MCGIGALLDPAGSAPPDAARRMAAALRHRGPDGEAIETHGPATLVHRRLAIVDVAGGDQPLRSEDGAISLVANGEIYNHEALRAGLEARGHRFATRSDCEVIVHLYEEHGDDCVRHLNGIFGFAIWDDRQRRLLVARDPLGVKPVYWHCAGRRVAVASEVGALLAAGLVEPRVDRVALDHYLACRFVPAPRTLFEGVSKLPAASTLVATGDAPPRVASYRAAPGTPLADLDGDELESELAKRFGDAVERQMMSDVPYGAFLSGGVDSAAIVAAMAQRSGTPPQTFTIGFPGYGDALDERGYAAETARAVGTDHHAIATERGDYLDELATAVRRLEEPCGIPSAPALMQLSRFAGESIKVALSGQGADEPHGGYGRHQAALALGAARRLGPLAAPIRAAAALMPGRERVRRAARLLGDMPDADRLVRLVEITGEGLRSELVGGAGEQAALERSALASDVLGDVPDRPLVERALYLDTHMFLPDSLLICGDKMSMTASLELRVPFLDVELLRFVERIPAKKRVRPRSGKHLHRKAMTRTLPPGLGHRPRHGFASPYDHWLRESVGTEVEQRYGAGGPLAELIDPATVTRLVAEHRAERADHKAILFCLLELSQWHRTFIQDVAPAEQVTGS
ncbi:MAG TPA: asparagine synthase (glutamine-hydrolyzing) [Thermoleophilaceae bacterium]|nr:asparagine synthase (glutamine-hydrolyzing) [Thermoleophilaceae bacterium]